MPTRSRMRSIEPSNSRMTLPSWRKNRGKEFNLNRKLMLNTPITRDFIQGQGACTFRMDVPDGVYRILLLAGYPVEREEDLGVFEFEARTNLGAARFRKTYPRAWFELHGFKAKAAGGKLEIELVPIGGVKEELREELAKKGVRFIGITSAFSRGFEREGVRTNRAEKRGESSEFRVQGSG